MFKLIYNRRYEKVEKYLSEFNVGARKRKSCLINIFAVNAIINETVKNKEAEPLSLQVMDVHQMFDSLRMDKTILNLFKNGFDSSELLVIRNANMEVIMAVKNCDDISEESKIYNVILQGDTLAPLISTI